MAVRKYDKSNSNAIDNNVCNRLMLVIDYTPDVKKIHDEANGGVIKSGGKEYLIVGVAGFGDVNYNYKGGTKVGEEKRDAYDTLWNPVTTKELGVIRKKRGEFFDSTKNKNERFYVSDDFTTEHVPGSILPGYMIKYLEGEEVPAEGESTPARKISDLLADTRNNGSNPLKLKLKDLSWGIMQEATFAEIRAKGEKRSIMYPRRDKENMGDAYVLIPASNGKLLPVQIKARKYGDEEFNRGSQLQQEIDQLAAKINIVGSKEDTMKAIIELARIFWFDKENDWLSLSKDGTSIWFKRKGSIVQTFKKGEGANKFIELLTSFNPRINITRRVLSDSKLLQKYDEAGALMTDCAALYTAGSAYGIFAVKEDGTRPLSAVSSVNQRGNSTPYVEKEFWGQTVSYGGRHIRLDKKTGKYYDMISTKEKKLIEDEQLIRELDYLRKIYGPDPVPIYASDGYVDIFVLNAGEHPEVVKVNTSTHKVTILTDKEAKEFIKNETEKAEKERRRREAIEEEGEDVPLGDWGNEPNEDDSKSEEEKKNEEEETPVEEMVDSSTKKVIVEQPIEKELKKRKEKRAEEKKDEKKAKKDNKKKNVTPPPPQRRSRKELEDLTAPDETPSGILSLTDLLNDEKYMGEVLGILVMSKFGIDIRDTSKIQEKLMSLDIDVTGMGDSEPGKYKGVQGYLDYLRCHLL